MIVPFDEPNLRLGERPMMPDIRFLSVKWRHPSDFATLWQKQGGHLARLLWHSVDQVN
ncbi:hypothetical protein [Aeromonas veronii]|uniref:hypothetical protein n=1 Tax=Aeromonas veronii TaxID=654 RepID=UPI002867E244|nr:hypothetical protein [Aeromonas veronii]